MFRNINNATLVFYDITNAKLRSKIDKAMKDFGIRFQYSVCLCYLDSEGVARCREKLLKIVNTYSTYKEDSDSVVILQQINIARMSFLLGKDESVYAALNCAKAAGIACPRIAEYNAHHRGGYE